ncbi:RNA polymerase sigma factor [Candidatus Gottesmanbacteria bacterium]|nr:RNA polymerase sigma factor [Candidatus Gottesmanbacteria bacterium]
MEDSELLDKILARDRKALSVFYRTYAPKLRRFIAAKINDVRDGEEVLQDTLFGFLEAIRDFQGKSNLQTFLFSIASHKVIDFYRRKKIKHVVFSKMPQLEALISPLMSPEEELDAVLLQEKVKSVIGRLMPNYQRVLVLKYFDHMSVEEIAQRLSITFKSAESQLFRARRAFVELFLSL